MLLIPLLLLPSFLFLVPLSAPASQDAGDTPLPPGTVTNLAGKTSPEPSCPQPKTTEQVAPASSWSATVNVPSSLFGGKPSGVNTTEIFTLAANGAFSATDNSGNSLELAPLAGLPSGILSVSMMANSTAALQTFTVTSGSTIVASTTASYSVITSFCYPAGLRMEISGDVAWKGNSGTVSIPFRSQPTFDHITRTKDNATAPFNPTRATFGHGKNAALAFDWSDSRKLGPTYDNATNSIDYRVGDTFLIDPVVTAATSGTHIATKTDYEGETCYASGRYWVFFDTGALEGMASSTDLSTWTVGTFATNGVHGLIGFYCTGDTLYYVAAASFSGSGVYYGYGTLEANGAFVPAIPEGFIPIPYQFVRGPSTVVDSSGRWWLAIGQGPVEVWRCDNPKACAWTESASFNSAGYADVVPMTNGRMAVVWTQLGYNTMGRLMISTFDGSAWSAPVEDPAAEAFRIDASTCVSIGDRIDCAVDNGDAAVGYISASYNANSPFWNSFVQVDPCPSPTNCYASMSTDGASDLVLTFADANVVGYAESFDSGADWGPLVQLSASEVNPVYVSSPYTLGGLVMAAWTEGTGPTYNVRVGVSMVQYPSAPTPPWGEQGLSPYGSYVNNAVVYVSMGNGLLSIDQPTFTLPGRGLSVSPSLFYNEPGAFQFGGTKTAKVDNFTLANLGLGWSLNLPWLGTYAVHLPSGQEYPYAWSGTDMQVHGPVDFELASAGSNGVCPCTLTLPSGVQFFFNSAKQLVAETDPTGQNKIAFDYGTNGMLSSIIDTVGRTVAFSYNSNNQLIAITAPGGRIWSLGYTGNQLTAETDPVGRITGFRYNSTLASGWLVDEVDYPTGGAKVTLTYGVGYIAGGISYVVNHRNVYSAAAVLSQTNYMSYLFSNGTIFVSSLGEAGGDGILQGLVVKAFSPSRGVEKTYLEDKGLGVFRVTENDYAGNRLTATKVEGPTGNILAESSFGYDNWGNPVYSRDNVGQQTWLSYANTDSSGTLGASGCATTGFYSNVIEANVHDRLVGSCDYQNGPVPAEQEVFYKSDTSGLLLETKVSHDGGWLYTDYAHDGYGNVLSVRDANGNYVYFTYSPVYGSAYLTRESRTAGAQVMATLYAYDPNAGFMTSTTDPNGHTTSYTYDAVGRTLTETYPPVNGVSSAVQYSYDDTNGVVTTIDPNGNVVKEYFDGLGRETQLQVFDGKKVYSNTYYTYSWMGQVSMVRLPSGSVYSYSYDSVGRPLAQTNPDGTKSTISYIDSNHIVTAHDEDGHQTLYYYNWVGRLTMVQQQVSASQAYFTTYSYDGVGNLLSTQNADGQVTKYSYDDLDRLKQVVSPDGNSTSYGYDSVGNLLTKTTSDGATIVYGYDSVDRLTSVAYPGGSSTSYTYDLDGNVLTVSSTLSGATQEAFAYDAVNRLTSTTTTVAGGSYITSYGYDPASNLVSVAYPNGYVVPMSYDFANRLADVGSMGSVAEFSYNVDNTVAQVSFGDKEVQSYTYDSRDRVTSIADTYHKVTPLNLTYAYDKASNVVGINTERFSYDNVSRLISATGGWGTTTYAYDGAGNMLASATGGVTSGYAGCGYYSNSVAASVWITCKTDKHGNIISKSGGWTYAYNPGDELVSAALNGVTRQTNVYDGFGNRVERIEANRTVFTYQGVNLLFERDLNTGVVTDHIYGKGMQLAKVTAGTTTYLHEDQLGSNRAETSVAKGKVNTQFSSDYQPYGQSYGATGSEAFRYTDRMLDSSTGLYYFNARLYDPSIMRFVQKDPGPVGLADPQSLNQYSYARDNPLSYVDPTGLYYGLSYGGECRRLGCESGGGSSLTPRQAFILGVIGLTAITIASFGLDPIADALDATAIAELAGGAAVAGAAWSGLPIVLMITDEEVDAALSMSPDEFAALVSGYLDRDTAADSRIATRLVQARAAAILGGTTEVEPITTGVRNYYGEYLKRTYDIKAGGTYYELKFNGDRPVTEQVEKDLSLRVPALGETVPKANVRYLFINGPEKGYDLARLANSIGETGIPYIHWTWETFLKSW